MLENALFPSIGKPLFLYKLVGVICHLGFSIHSGHYTSFSLNE
jgi:uncharacterized UBP type Zn finger protein